MKKLAELQSAEFVYLLDSAARQIWLMESLGFPPPRYGHVPLLLSADGRRLSKRDRDLDVGLLRAEKRPEEVVGWLGTLAGLCPPGTACTASELLPAFRTHELPRTDIYVPRMGDYGEMMP